MSSIVIPQLPGQWEESEIETPPNEQDAHDSPTSGVFDTPFTRTSSSRSTSPGSIYESTKSNTLDEISSIRSSIEAQNITASSPSEKLTLGSNDNFCNSGSTELFPIDMTDVDDTNWKSYPIPAELLEVSESVPMEIETILEASIEILQNRLLEEDSIRQHEKRQAEEEAARNKGKGKEVMRNNEIDSSTSNVSHPPTRPAPVPRRSINVTSSTTSAAAMQGKGNDGISLSVKSNGISRSTGSGLASRSGESSSRKGKGIAFTFGSFFKRSKQVTLASVMIPDQSLAEHSSGDVAEVATKECVSCLDEFDRKETVHLECHDYCKICFESLIETAVTTETYWPPKCCLNEIPVNLITFNISAALDRRYAAIAAERSVPASERIYCSKPSCAQFILPSYIDQKTSTATCNNVTCRTKTCTLCHGASHPASTPCPSDTALIATLALATREGWKRCYECSALIEHNQGCIHMTCKCRAQFCYICGLRWRTCSCSDAALTTLRMEAEARQRTRQLEEVQERRTARLLTLELERVARELRAQEEELAEMLREIAEFEAREQAEAESLRQAAQRAREQRERERTERVHARFLQLREDLEILHLAQQISMRERYDRAIRMLKDDREGREVREDSMQREMDVAIQTCQTRLSEFVSRRDEEFKARLKGEREIEDVWAEQLKAYWIQHGDVDPVARVAQALEMQRTRDYNMQREWEMGKREQYRQMKGQAELEIRRLSLRHDEVRRRVRICEENELRKVVMYKRGRFADDKWLEAVAGVREEMLLEMERQEYAAEE